MQDRALNEKEAADFLGLSVCTLRNYRHASRGPAYLKLSRAIRYLESDLREYRESKRVVPEKRQ
jgi:predicted DNA-binding transcriptional regulator AlpA